MSVDAIPFIPYSVLEATTLDILQMGNSFYLKRKVSKQTLLPKERGRRYLFHFWLLDPELTNHSQSLETEFEIVYSLWLLINKSILIM